MSAMTFCQNYICALVKKEKKKKTKKTKKGEKRDVSKWKNVKPKPFIDDK